MGKISDHLTTMRNIFDQYDQAENRVTHALMSALDCDRKLLRSFMLDVVKLRPPIPADKLVLLEQQLPGSHSPPEDELEPKGIPDGWIFSEAASWCLIIESKVTAKLTRQQIQRHQHTARRRGFSNIHVVCILPTPFRGDAAGARTLEWQVIYRWLKQKNGSRDWAMRTARYLEIAEERLIQSKKFVEGRLTSFSGFPFGVEQPYNYLEAKRLLSLAMQGLKANTTLRKELGIVPSAKGRPAITGRDGDAVWDFISLTPSEDSRAFTQHPHLTLGIGARGIDAMVTVPNAVNKAMRRRVVQLSELGFRDLVAETIELLRPILKAAPGASPRFVGIQRRYPSQKAKPHIDARLDFDLRTIAPSKVGPKTQTAWLAAAFEAFARRGKSNYQIQIGIHFPYDRCPQVRDPNSLELVAKTWLGCRRLIELDRP